MHSDSDFHGESLGESLSYSVEDNLTGETPINMWYEEISNYNFNKPGFTSGMDILLNLSGKYKRVWNWILLPKI